MWRNDENCDVVMSFNTHLFENTFQIVSHSVMKIGQLLDKVMDKIFTKNLAWFGALGPKCSPISIYQLTAINQKPIYDETMFFTLLTVCTETTKNSKCHPYLVPFRFDTSKDLVILDKLQTDM